LNPFNINSEFQFKEKAIALFKSQYNNNLIYNQYCKLLKINLNKIKEINQIPFLPIQFFKTHKIISTKNKITHIFKSSGTNGTRSLNYVSNIKKYTNSFRKSFEIFYGPVKNYIFLALLPSYLEQKNSSLIYMIDNFIKTSRFDESKFYLNNYSELYDTLKKINNSKVILFGVSFALLDFIEKYTIVNSDLIIVETGGMKGRKKEISRDELHKKLKAGYGTKNIHSEYGMTELFSQAYSKEKGLFKNPPWMKTFVRDINNPLAVNNCGKGAINIIDLANEHSIAFIATDDIGQVFENETYTISGRLNESEIRGCNQMFN
jgi:phenylacetate-coenzyme A ligase PaaK-like adenylate-forming protein